MHDSYIEIEGMVLASPCGTALCTISNRQLRHQPNFNMEAYISFSALSQAHTSIELQEVVQYICTVM